jgi:aromatic ring-cleaving dioxygenase
MNIYHAHIYYNLSEIEAAKNLAAQAQAQFPIAIGRFHEGPVGPHPRGSCQLTVPVEIVGEFFQWLPFHRNGLTIFAHPDSGNDLLDHTEHVIWFGPSEDLRLAGF